MNTFGTALLYAVPLFRQGQPDVSEQDMEKTIMKALSIHPEYAMNIIKGLKTVEV